MKLYAEPLVFWLVFGYREGSEPRRMAASRNWSSERARSVRNERFEVYWKEGTDAYRSKEVMSLSTPG